uniref:Uncharacterized protein n=1 Tax=Chromera velia CCMP2878 TaxID=1169474 RepID=A0A0G4HRP2_9ALVE|eukprot:Cvel_8119.t1-p1 / transcript=Cvel_8119.t1 / gene=Cvel_8119 / organism=Chromera_velia_CCMP2878 / gene_product=hypothetical protein / transcript_product=hypothetical protein / location=Cvel_scaffold441:81889-82692(+) / protein_length=268 / sequence_SO=supercontig / SO=protein_coding / is_pseudo=false
MDPHASLTNVKRLRAATEAVSRKVALLQSLLVDFLSQSDGTAGPSLAPLAETLPQKHREVRQLSSALDPLISRFYKFRLEGPNVPPWLLPTVRSFVPISAETLMGSVEKFIQAGDRGDLSLHLKVGADVDGLVGPYGGETALVRAVRRGHLGAIKFLLTHGKASRDKLKQQRIYQSPLGIAFREKQGDAARMLLAAGAQVTGLPGLFVFAAERGAPPDVVETMLDRGVDIEDTGGDFERTALLEACDGGHEGVVRHLVSARDAREGCG